MKRCISQKLAQWFDDAKRKPLVLKGARQVGKTYTVNAFGHDFVEGHRRGQYHYLDLRRQVALHSIFEENQDPKKILELIELYQKVRIDPEVDLLFLDEIQDCAQAIASLKYFEQNLQQLRVIVAGSHLGLVQNEASFPVGKVNFLSMFPMTFYEFVWALDPVLCAFLDEFDIAHPKSIPSLAHEKLLECLSAYFAVGGLPECVDRYQQLRETQGLEALRSVRQVQQELLMGYQADFSKYSGTVNANHIHSVFESIPKQLAQSFDESTSKYKFSGVIPNQKGFDRIVGPLTWLTKSRLCIKNFIAKKSGHPLAAYTANNVFKVFYMDVGLLNAALETPMEAIVKNSLDSYKGFLVENYVAQELYAQLDHDLMSWQEGDSEIEFLITRKEDIVPIEVKSGVKSRRAKSLDSYIAKYQPRFAYKLSPQNVGQGGKFLTLPLYLCANLLATHESERSRRR